eukprot:GHVU01004362.1.p1 GENE.GHVU01004362.1~~GHVU01004362.1.p1  ORF type:complete len:483 (-),score=86.96 GHVU01004362.1:261-1709(-)
MSPLLRALGLTRHSKLLEFGRKHTLVAPIFHTHILPMSSLFLRPSRRALGQLVRRNAPAFSPAFLPSAGLLRRPFSTKQPQPEEKEVIYHEGLRWTEFTTECKIDDKSPVIPIFRVLGYDGNIIGDWKLPVDDGTVKEWYLRMLRLNIWDRMLYNIQRQGRISFYIQNQGEEALQVGIGAALKENDQLWCQYRELGVFLFRGFSLADVLGQLYSTKRDPGKGRQMPISYTKREIGLHTICTPLTTQVPHAAGCGYALKQEGGDKVAVTFFGEGAASEGDFHAAMNFAAVRRSQTIFVCRNNGYAISTPVRDQYKGDGIAIRGLAYGMQTIRVDGNDLFASYIAMEKARELCVKNSEPVCMEYMTYRVGHHSTSDDSAQYRPKGEMEAWSQSGVNAIARVRKYLQNRGLLTEEEDEQVRQSAKKEMLAEMKKAEGEKSLPIAPGIFDDVYDKYEWNVREQREEFEKHMKKYGDKYDTSKFETE